MRASLLQVTQIHSKRGLLYVKRGWLVCPRLWWSWEYRIFKTTQTVSPRRSYGPKGLFHEIWKGSIWVCPIQRLCQSQFGWQAWQQTLIWHYGTLPVLLVKSIFLLQTSITYLMYYKLHATTGQRTLIATKCSSMLWMSQPSSSRTSGGLLGKEDDDTLASNWEKTANSGNNIGPFILDTPFSCRGDLLVWGKESEKRFGEGSRRPLPRPKQIYPCCQSFVRLTDSWLPSFSSLQNQSSSASVTLDLWQSQLDSSPSSNP